MPDAAAIAMSPAWPLPDDSGRCVLVPTTTALAKTCAIFLMMIVAGGMLAAPPHAPQVIRIKGLLFLIMGLGLGTSFLYRMMTGAFELRLDESGFSLGKKYCTWADTSTFALGTGRKRKILYFIHKGELRPLANLYGMTGPALVEFLNQQRGQPGSAMTLPTPDFLPPLPVRRKTLPFGAWVAIGALFLFFLAAGGPMLKMVWGLAPANMQNDQNLTDRAGFDPSLLAVLLARAQAGDKSAMYHYGDVFDPTDFTCETAVPKDPTVSVYWYEKAVALDDQGAERALGNLYHQGIGVPRDDGMAAMLLERAVAHNDDFGDYYLGQMLEAGQGEKQNFTRAAQLEQAAAAQGNMLGETELGRMYFNGLGVARDTGQAAKYWRQAAAQGNDEAQTLLTQQGL